ncbi:hypothetical protein JTE90_027992 [Oedothorax gibbosus]|uniref:Fibrinogen C-terminal domain-containing protein n=1 Tax=Oedothorax gibbosus TaxID=931172 RepID=A0AAV6VDR4_9ARAC|nr:hypothetical protein JTE90_027992 [Oedothorax gibbosus]
MALGDDNYYRMAVNDKMSINNHNALLTKTNLIMKNIQLFVLVITLALSTAFTITNNSTDLDNNVERSSQITNKSFPKPADCEEVRLNGNRINGLYNIWPRNRKLACKSVEVYCDMKTDGGGWTVLQRRGNYGNAPNYFNKTWEFYKRGFGHLEKDFWLGNDVIYALTNQGSYSVRFDMRAANGTSAYALYDEFWIEDEAQKYHMNILGYSGNAGDSMNVHHGMKFSTFDNDNDKSSGNCAADGFATGGWWFNNCIEANFNGLYYPLGKYSGSFNNGVTWKSFGGTFNSMTNHEENSTFRISDYFSAMCRIFNRK